MFFENLAGDRELAKYLWPSKFDAMSATEILEQLRRMPAAERREVVEAIEMEFGDFGDELTPQQTAELERRAEDALKHPGRGTPIEQVSAEIKQRLLAKK
jgi:putative addiction module component (TIGR02574 family)